MILFYKAGPQVYKGSVYPLPSTAPGIHYVCATNIPNTSRLVFVPF